MISLQALLANALVTIGNSTELALIGKASLVLCTGLLAARLLTRGRASVRHVLLAATFVTLLVLPIAAAMMPRGRPRDCRRTEDPAVVRRTTATAPPRWPSRSAVPALSRGGHRCRRAAGVWPTCARIVWGIGVLSVLA